MVKEIKGLHAELEANGGIVPESWYPYIGLFKVLLKVAKLFTGEKVDDIIDKVLAAIDLCTGSAVYLEWKSGRE